MSTAHIYARISLDSEGDEHGVTSQLQQCRAFAAERGWTVAGEYTDNDVSAYSGVERPQFEQLLKDMNAGRIRHLLIWHVDRLCRRVADLVRVIEAAKAGGVEIHSLKAGEIDLSNASGELMAHMLGAVAQFEARHLSERQVASQQDRARRGVWRGGRAPYGYRLKSKGVLEVDEAEAEWLRMWARQLQAGETLFSLVKRTKQAVANEQDSPLRALALSSLKSRLLNPAVAGLVKYKGEIIGKGDWPAIIPAEEWFALHALLTDPSRRKNQGTARKWQGSGVYRCGKCGSTCRTKMARQKTAKRLYICYNDCVSVSREDLDALVDTIIVGYFNKPENRLQVAKKDEKSGRRVAELDESRRELTRRKEQLAAMFMNGLVDEGQLKAATLEFNEKLARIELDMSAARSASPLVDLLMSEEDVQARWEVMPADNRAEIIDMLMTVTVMPAQRGRRESAAERTVIEWKD